MRALTGSTKAIAMLTACLLATTAVMYARTTTALSQLSLLQDIRHEIVSGYVEPADEKKMIDAAVYAMVDSLDDRFTVYLPPEEVEEFGQQVQGEFTGIGVEYVIDDDLDRVKVVTPLEDSPAWRAGVMAGDVILDIEGDSTEGMKEREVRDRLMGPADTKVNIRVRHDSGEEQDITITRALISVRTVRGFRRGADNRWQYMLDAEHGIGYVKLRQFNDRTVPELREALEEMLEHNLQALILDLRFNPGGMLDAAIEVSDMFLEKGKTIVSVQGRTVPRKSQAATRPDMLSGMPVVVLANEASASASEVVTGALTDNERARFIGMRTFGKGSVQQVRALESGQGALKITVSYYYLPNGRLIHRRADSEVWGVDPHEGFFVPMSPDAMRKMIEARINGSQLRQHEGPITPQWIQEQLADPQLAAAVEAISGKLDSGDWPVVGESGADLLARRSQREQLKRRRELVAETLAEIDEQLNELDQQEADPDESDAADEKREP